MKYLLEDRDYNTAIYPQTDLNDDLSVDIKTLDPDKTELSIDNETKPGNAKTRDPIRVLIVDDHVLIREGIRAILENQPDVKVVGEATNGREAVALAEELMPNIILMDISMPVMNGLEATIKIKEMFPEINILTLTIHEDDQYFFNILKAGASGYFIKGGSSAELISALHTVREGNIFLYPTMAKKLLSSYLDTSGSRDNDNGLDSLSPREKEIFKLVAEDNSNREIAARLFLSPATVQTHRSNIMAKLNLHSRTELTKYAISHGIISLES